MATLSGKASLAAGPTPSDFARANHIAAERSDLIARALETHEIRAALTDPDLSLGADDLRRRALAEFNALCAGANDILNSYLITTDSPNERVRSAAARRIFRPAFAVGLTAAITLTIETILPVSFIPRSIIVAGLLASLAMAIIGGAVEIFGKPRRLIEILSRRYRSEALVEWRNYVLYDGILPLFRSIINERFAPLRWPTMKIIDAPGLDNVRELQLVVDTDSNQRFWEVLKQVRTGAIGVAGPRGVGKTTLLEKYLKAQWQTMTLLVSAPVHYDAREFVLHLYATLCRTALGRWPMSRLQGRASAQFSSARLLGYLISTGILVSSGWALAGVMTGGSATDVSSILAAIKSLTASDVRLWPTLLLWLIAILMIERMTRSVLPGRRFKRRRELLFETRHRLSRVRYLQTTTIGWSGAFTMPGGKIARSAKAERAEQPLTYPEIVAQLRQYLELLVRFSHGVIVVIDELDKIERAEDAQAFINEIKGILGVEGTQFIITVSEDALAAFERRGLPIRDAFDSTFDEVVWIEALNVTDSCTLLHKRVIGLSDLFCALAHCVSGGLPRDLIRTARLMRSIAGTDRVRIEPICTGLINDDLSRKVRAYQIATGDLSGESGTARFVRTLRGLSPDPVQLRHALPDLVGKGSGSEALRVLGLQAAVYVYHCATILEVFNTKLTQEEFDGRRDDLDALARAKQALAIYPEVAWQTLDEVRAAWGLEVVPLDQLASDVDHVTQTPSPRR